jgi:hypothetical protein
MNEDKRQTQRVGFTSEVSAFSVLPSKSGHIFEVYPQHHLYHSVDISRGGIRLTTHKPFPQDSILKLKVEILKKRPLDIFARVVWSNDHHTGLKFIVLHEEVQRHIAQYTRTSE